MSAARELLRQARHPAVVLGYEYWIQARARSGKTFPGRQHLDPVDMGGFLPHVILTEVVRNGPHYRFRHRLIGTHFAEFLGREVTGQFIEHQGWLHIFDDLYRRFSTAVDERALVYGVSADPNRERGFMGYEHLTLPLASDGDVIDMLFGIRCVLPSYETHFVPGQQVAPLAER